MIYLWFSSTTVPVGNLLATPPTQLKPLENSVTNQHNCGAHLRLDKISRVMSKFVQKQGQIAR